MTAGGLPDAETLIDHARGLVGLLIAGRPAVLELIDWRRLDATGPWIRWTTAASRGNRFPALVHPVAGVVMVARLIVGATAGQEIGYRDGDPFNLCRWNLVVRDVSRRHRRRVELPRLSGRAEGAA